MIDEQEEMNISLRNIYRNINVEYIANKRLNNSL